MFVRCHKASHSGQHASIYTDCVIIPFCGSLLIDISGCYLQRHWMMLRSPDREFDVLQSGNMTTNAHQCLKVSQLCWRRLATDFMKQQLRPYMQLQFSCDVIHANCASSDSQKGGMFHFNWSTQQIETSSITLSYLVAKFWCKDKGCKGSVWGGGGMHEYGEEEQVSFWWPIVTMETWLTFQFWHYAWSYLTHHAVFNLISKVLEA